MTRTVGEAGPHLPISLISTTTLRFVMLGFTATAIVTSAAHVVMQVLVDDVDTSAISESNECVIGQLRHIAQAWRRNGAVPDMQALGKCPERTVSILSTALPFVGAILFWTSVVAALWLLPAWRIRRRRYEPTGRIGPEGRLSPAADHPGTLRLLATLAGLQRGTDLTVPVTYFLDRLDPRCSALAFGRPGMRCIVLSGGLERLADRDPEAFNAIVLHELAHIRNRDIDIGFFTILAWRIVLPVLAWQIFNGFVAIVEPATSGVAMAFEVLYGLQVLVLGAVSHLLRNSVLRSRELFADNRVAQWSGEVEGFTAMLTTYFPDASGRRRQLFRVHPPRSRRIAVLRDSHLLRPINMWDWCAVGFVAAALAWDVEESWPQNNGGLAAMWVAYFVAALFLTGALGVEAWLDPEQRRADRRFEDDASMAVGVGFGLALGIGLLNPLTVSVMIIVRDASLTQFAIWLLIACVMAWLSRAWLGLVAASWVDIVSARSPRGATASWWALAVVSALPIFLTLLYLVQLLPTAILLPMLHGFLVPFGIVVEFMLGALIRWFGLLVLMALGVLLIPYAGRRASRKRLRRLVYAGRSHPPEGRLRAAHAIAARRTDEGCRAFHHLASTQELPDDQRVLAAIHLARIRTDLGFHLLTRLAADATLTPSARLRATEEAWRIQRAPRQ